MYTSFQIHADGGDAGRAYGLEEEEIRGDEAMWAVRSKTGNQVVLTYALISPYGHVLGYTSREITPFVRQLLCMASANMGRSQYCGTLALRKWERSQADLAPGICSKRF
jgi:hypothetical protein